MKFKSVFLILFFASIIENLSFADDLQAPAITTITPKRIDMGIVTEYSFDNGFIENIHACFLNIRSNDVNWNLFVKALDPNMGHSGPYTKNLSDFSFKVDSKYAKHGNYEVINTFDKLIAQGPPSNETKLYMDYKILLAWARDIPGIYNLRLLYTITSNS